MVNLRICPIGALVAAVSVVGCKPDDDGRPSLLEEPRILAIRALPAEVKPTGQTTLEILRAGPTGRTGSSEASIALCLARKRIAESGIVSGECLERAPDEGVLEPVANAEPITATIPEDTCSRFGPKVLTESNEDPVRPADPDQTGGYYQPIRVVDDTLVSIFPARITCDLTRTSQEASIGYNRRYSANENPSVSELLLGRENGDVEALSKTTPALVRRDESVLLAVTWPTCPKDKRECGDGMCGLDENALLCQADCLDDSARRLCDRETGEKAIRLCLEGSVKPLPRCDGAETYLLLDPVSSQLRLERESIRVSWFVTGGALERDKSGRASDDTAREAQNRWTAPSRPGTYWLIAVIRDDRGGTNWTIQPIVVDQ